MRNAVIGRRLFRNLFQNTNKMESFRPPPKVISSIIRILLDLFHCSHAAPRDKIDSTNLPYGRTWCATNNSIKSFRLPLKHPTVNAGHRNYTDKRTATISQKYRFVLFCAFLSGLARERLVRSISNEWVRCFKPNICIRIHMRTDAHRYTCIHLRTKRERERKAHAKERKSMRNAYARVWCGRINSKLDMVAVFGQWMMMGIRYTIRFDAIYACIWECGRAKQGDIMATVRFMRICLTQRRNVE